MFYSQRLKCDLVVRVGEVRLRVMCKIMDHTLRKCYWIVLLLSTIVKLTLKQSQKQKLSKILIHMSTTSPPPSSVEIWFAVSYHTTIDQIFSES